MLRSLFKKKEKVSIVELLAEGAVIVDVRSKEEYETGHAKGAINIPLDTLEKNITKLGDPTSAIITCCRSGNRSAMAKSVLEKHGFKNVHNGGSWEEVSQAQK